MLSKIKSLKEIGEIVEKEKKLGHKVVQCHGVFDLLHPGHLRHFKEAKAQGDCLVISVTPDCFVNKGPGRPVFNENLRVENLAELSVVDYVVLNNEPTAVGAIYSVKPNVYVKGSEYSNPSEDITGKITDEVNAVKRFGGDIFFTEDIVFSSSSLLNRFFEEHSDEVKAFLSQFRSKYSATEIVQKLEMLKALKVLVIGDAIIDEYQYVTTLGQSAKGLHMSALLEEKEVFLGGSLIISKHIADFTDDITLLTAIGDNCEYRNFINDMLEGHTKTEFILQKQTLIKKRYVQNYGTRLSKLFETYSTNEYTLSPKAKKQFREKILDHVAGKDLILISDFGNGLIDYELAQELSQLPQFIGLNVQSNSGNRGFNVITKYNRADFISINEPELRLAVHNREHSIPVLIEELSRKIACKNISITSGVKGLSCFTNAKLIGQIPAFATNAVDRVGAGDSYLALASMCLAAGFDHELAGFVGALAAAMDVEFVGNKESIRKVPLCKYITRILK